MRNVGDHNELAFDLICLCESHVAFLTISIKAEKYQLFDKDVVVDKSWLPNETATRLIK